MSIFQEKWVNNGSIETESGRFVCAAGADDIINYIVNIHNHYLDMLQKANIVIGTLERIAKVTALNSAATIGESGRDIQINHIQDSTDLERIASAIQVDGYKVEAFKESENGNISLGKFDAQNSDGLEMNLNAEAPEWAK